jgi:hypothetical protein
MEAKCRDKRTKKEAQGLRPWARGGRPAAELSNYPGHCSLGRFFSRPPGCVVAESFEDPHEREVGGEWCTRVRMRLPTKLTKCSPSIHSTCLSRSGREPIHPVTSTNQRAMLPSGSHGIGGGSRPNVANIGLTWTVRPQKARMVLANADRAWATAREDAISFSRALSSCVMVSPMLASRSATAAARDSAATTATCSSPCSAV